MQVHRTFEGGGAGVDAGQDGLKQGILGWSSGYYVAYCLIMTIAFALVIDLPEPSDHVGVPETVNEYIKWRPTSDAVDAVVELLHIFFVLMACYDSTWGLVLCSEWAVRAPCVPANT